MALSLGGIMRGALPVATQYLTETPDANTQLINAIGEKFDNIGNEINPKIAAAQANIDTIEDIANTYGVGTDIVAGLYSATGGKRKETIQQLKNLLDTYGSADLIPMENMPTSTVDITDTQQVNVASAPPMDDESIFQEIASLFKRLGPEEAISAFARQRGITESKVVDFLQGNVGKYIPEYDAKTKLTSDAALAALEAPKDPDQPLVSGGLRAAFYQQLVDKQKDSRDNPGKYSEEHSKLLAAFPTQYLEALKEDNVGNNIKLKNIASMFTKILPVDRTDKEIPEQYKGIMESASEIIKTAIGDPKVIYDATLVNSLINETSATNIDYDEIGSLVQQILNTKKIPQGQLSTDDIYFNALVAKILRAPGNDNITLPEAQQMAAEFIKTNPTYDSSGMAWTKIIGPGGGVAVQQVEMFDSDANITIPTKLKNEIKGQMAILGDAFDSIGSLKTLLREDDFLGGNNTFATILTTARMRGGDVLSLLGAPNVAAKLKGGPLQQALQQRISFVKRTKEEIFDDPRLSDKDLAIIIDYIGILYDPTISNERALAALLGIEKALTNAYIRNVKDLYPSLPTAVMVNGQPNFGKLSVSKSVLDNLLMANGIMTIDQFTSTKRSKKESAEYAALTKPYRELVANGVKRLIYFEDVEGKLNEQKYKEEFVTDFGDNMQAATIAGKTMEEVYNQAIQNGFDAKKVLNALNRKRRGIL